MSKTKNGTTKKFTEKELAGTVDRLGEVRAEKKKLETEEKDLKKILDPLLEKGVTLSGQKYVASKTIPTNRVPNNKKVIKKMGIDWFIEHASIALGVLADAMGKEDIDSVVTEVDGAPRINTDLI